MSCIGYSHGQLDPEAQALLLCFAPFIGVIDTQQLDNYRQRLTEEPELAALPLARLGEVLERTRELGLLQRDTDAPQLLRPQPALGWFLTNRLAMSEQDGLRVAVLQAFRKHYDGLAGWLAGLQGSKDPQERQLGHMLVEREYANLGTALRIALDQQTSILNQYRVLSSHLDPA